MKIIYKNEKIREQYESNDFLDRKFEVKIRKKYNDFKDKVFVSKDLNELKMVFPGLRIEKLVHRDNVWSARINKQYRVEFTINKDGDLFVDEICVNKIHSHTY